MPNPAEFVGTCPACFRAEKFYRNRVKRVGYCQRCGYSVGPKEYGADSPAATGLRIRPASQPKLVPAWSDVDARQYLVGRGVLSEHLDIEYCPEERRLYFRIWSPLPEFAPDWHTRSIEAGQGWRGLHGSKKSHYLWGHASPSADAVVVEGIFDALRVGSAAVSLLGTHLSEGQAQFLGSCRKIYLWLDPDPAGRLATRKIEATLMFYPVDVVSVRYHKEPGDCTPDEVREVLGKAGWTCG